LETKTNQLQHDGIVEKWTQFVDLAMWKLHIVKDVMVIWGIFAVSSLLPWSAVCCYITATSGANIKIFSSQGPDEYMRNVVYREVLEM
jgi:hypothetical protein